MAETSDFADGVHYILMGFRWLNKPGLRRFVWIPLLVNIILFSVMIYFGVAWFSLFTHWLDQFLPSWLLWLNWLLWILFAISLLIILTYTFTLIANLIATPFNGLLSEKVEVLLTGQRISEPINWLELIKDVPRALKRQLHFILYYLPRAILALVLFFVPFIQIAAGPIWFLFNAWMMSIQYFDYPTDNHRISFADMRRLLNAKRGLNFGFGIIVMVATMIPFLNFFVMPAAVIGATILYVERYQAEQSTIIGNPG